MNNLNENKINFLRSTDSKFVRQIKGNPINNCNVFRVRNSSQWQPLFLLAPGFRNVVTPLPIRKPDPLWTDVAGKL
jgi:hypothetical protein